jgi:hypothetical protein
MPKNVTTISGTSPFLVIAPHGAQTDDYNTDIVAYSMVEELGAFGVINFGYQRAKKFAKDGHANLNSLKHCFNSPVKEEFLEPVFKYKAEIVKKFGICYIYLIHGMSPALRVKTKDNVHMVVGYGQGEPPSFSCTIENKDAFCYLMSKLNFNVYQGKSGGRFSAWQADNVNQLFRKKKYLDENVQSIQVELITSLRLARGTACFIGEVLGKVAEQLYDKGANVPKDFLVKEY